MKKIFKTAIAAVAMLTISAFGANAQTTDTATDSVACAKQECKKAKKDRPNPEQLARRQAEMIAGKLKLDSEKSQRFITAFTDCQKEMWADAPKPLRKTDGMTDQQVKDALKAQFDHMQKVLDVRKKYFEVYGQFLTPQQIAQVYNLERGMHKNFGKHKGTKPGKDMGKKDGRKGGKSGKDLSKKDGKSAKDLSKKDGKSGKQGRRAPQPQQVSQAK